MVYDFKLYVQQNNHNVFTFVIISITDRISDAVKNSLSEVLSEMYEFLTS